MIEIDIPGFGDLRLEHLVLDYNGTLAVDGRPVAGVKSALFEASRHLAVHVLTADTFGRVRQAMADVDCTVFVLPPGRQDQGKLAFVQKLGLEKTAAIGNGRNDALMLEASRLGVAVVLQEGASAAALQAADVVCTDVLSALDLLFHPLRLTATLRT